MERTNKFISYCMSFYGKDGLYPIKGITPKKIKDAICEISLGARVHLFSCGDSYDREVVRDFILLDMEAKKRIKAKLKETNNVV